MLDSTHVEGAGVRVGIVGAGIGGLCAAIGFERAGAEVVVFEQAALHEILCSALPKRVIKTESRFLTAEPDGLLRWKSGSEERYARFDLIVAADGINSRIRESRPDDPGITYSGYSAWRGITETPIDLHAEAGETWGLKKRFGVAPLKDGRVYWFAVLSVNRNWRIDESGDVLAEQFSGWHDPIPEIISATDPNHIGYLPIDELAGCLTTYVNGRVVLLGDAAHAMTPNLGQGGNQAMEDAATITALFEAYASVAPTEDQITTVLALYDVLRVKRTQTIAARSRMIGRLAHSPGPALIGMRNLLLRMTSTATLRKQLAWLQGWTPPSAR